MTPTDTQPDVYYTTTLAYPGASTTNTAPTLAGAIDLGADMVRRHFDGVTLTEDQRVVLASVGTVRGSTKRYAPLNFYWYLSVRRNVAPESTAHLVAYGRPETDPCERGTVGCCIAHRTIAEVPCETW